MGGAATCDVEIFGPVAVWRRGSLPFRHLTGLVPARTAEILTRDELVQVFNLEGLQKSPAIFDVQKIQWMNSFYIKSLPVEEIAKRARPYFEKSGLLSGRSEGWYLSVVSALRGDVNLLSELPSAAERLFAEPRVRINTDIPDTKILNWNESAAWDEVARYYS